MALAGVVITVASVHSLAERNWFGIRHCSFDWKPFGTGHHDPESHDHIDYRMRIPMREIAELISVLACALFTGAAVYITFVEHPARMQCGVEIAATEFAPSYRRATVMQATCAAVGLLSSVAAWLAGATIWWLIAGLLLGSVIPFTLV